MMKQVIGACVVVVLGAGPSVAAGAQQQAGNIVVRQRVEGGVAPVVADQTRVVSEARLRVPLEAKTVTGAPYSAEIVNESIQVLTDGNRIVRQERSRVTRDSQGRVRREVERDGQVVSVTITDPVAKVSYSLDPASRMAWKTPGGVAGGLAYAVYPMDVPRTGADADPAEVERRLKVEHELQQKVEQTVQVERRKREAGAVSGAAGVVVPPPPPPPPPPTSGFTATRERNPGWEEKVEELAPRQIEGVQATGKRTTRTIPAGAIGNDRPIVTVSEEWRSPELQVLVLTTTTDPRVGDTVYKLVNINRSEPAPSLFDVPSDYTVKETGIRRMPAQR